MSARVAASALGPLQRDHPAPPVRLLHLGLGSFFRAHQAWYTDRAEDAEHWGYAAFGGRSGRLAHTLAGQDGLYTLVTRAESGDLPRVISALSATHPAGDMAAWERYWRDPAVAIMTMTVTEAGYLPGAGPIARIVAGLRARRAAGAGPIVLLPCDNLPGNGQVLRAALLDLADSLEPGLVAWAGDHVIVGSTMVDRITPAPTPTLPAEVEHLTGRIDAAPVVAEPYAEWVIAADFPAGAPAWDATVVDSVEPYERRKLWLLNGGHSLLAYLGILRGHATVSEAMADPECRGWLRRWWDEAQRHLDLDAGEVARYRARLVERFTNPRIRHELAQIAADGSQKLPARILPVLRAERAVGAMPSGAIGILGAWIAFLRRRPALVRDPQARLLTERAAQPGQASTRRLLAVVDAGLAADLDTVAAVHRAAGCFAPQTTTA